MADPIHQFKINELFPVVKIAGQQIHFTNSAFYMLLAVGLTAALMLGPTAGRRPGPTRIQSLAEGAYEFIAKKIRSHTREQGPKLFPLVFSLFIFILLFNR